MFLHRQARKHTRDDTDMLQFVFAIKMRFNEHMREFHTQTHKPAAVVNLHTVLTQVVLNSVLLCMCLFSSASVFRIRPA